MSNVIKIDEKIKEKNRKKQAEDYQERIDAILRTVQCSSCQLKCAMCGYHLDSSGCNCSQDPSFYEFILCEDCRDEFEDYLDLANGRESVKNLWHNREWMDLWASWLKFQRSIKEFRNSAEFRTLVEDNES
jgi:hypothetical protein